MFSRFARRLAAGTMFALSVSSADAAEIPLTFTTTSSSATIIPNGATVTRSAFTNATATISLTAGSYSFVWKETLGPMDSGYNSLYVAFSDWLGNNGIYNPFYLTVNNSTSARDYVYTYEFVLSVPRTLVFTLTQSVAPMDGGRASITGTVTLTGPAQPLPTPVPGPIAGAGLPVAAGLLGFAAWRRRRTAVTRT